MYLAISKLQQKWVKVHFKNQTSLPQKQSAEKAKPWLQNERENCFCLSFLLEKNMQNVIAFPNAYLLLLMKQFQYAF